MYKFTQEKKDQLRELKELEEKLEIELDWLGLYTKSSQTLDLTIQILKKRLKNNKY